MNLRGILTSLINYRSMIGFRANNRQRVIGTFCDFHVNSKQRKTYGVRVYAAVRREDRCVTTLITAAKGTKWFNKPITFKVVISCVRAQACF